MKLGTHETGRHHAQTGELQAERWWIWKAGRRRYSTIEPTADKEAGARRTRRQTFRGEYLRSQVAAKAPKSQTWQASKPTIWRTHIKAIMAERKAARGRLLQPTVG